MNQRYAYTADVKIGEEEHTVPFNHATFFLDYVNSTSFSADEGEAWWTYERIDGLPTEDTEVIHRLNDAEGKESDPMEKLLTKDPAVYVDGDEVVIAGQTAFHGAGDPMETRLPLKACTFTFSGDPDELWARHQHEVLEAFDENIFEDPDPEVLFFVDEEDEEEVDAEEVDAKGPFEEVFKRFASMRDDWWFDANMAWSDETGSVVAVEAGSVALSSKSGSTIVRDADPDAFRISDDFHNLVTWDDFYALPGARETVSTRSDGPWLVYEDDDVNIVLG